MTSDLNNDQRGWILVFCSALTCTIGSFVICIDRLWSKWFPKYSFDFKESKGILVASLSMSSGVLLFTSWYKLLPEALEYFEQSPELVRFDTELVLFGTYFLGVGICTAINVVIHALTSQSVVHCAHDGETGEHNDGDASSDHHHHHHHHHSSVDHEVEDDDESTETTTIIALEGEDTPLLRNPKSMSIIDLTTTKLRGKKYIGKCMGYSSIDDCVVITEPGNSSSYHGDGDHHDDLQINANTNIERHLSPSHDHVKHKGDHHHHVSTRYSHLFSIGLQTALAISVHKIPEGFLTFATTHGNPELGFSVFLALAIHNFSEGFTIAFPLYLALGSRTIAIGAAVALGGLAQPLGAIMAWAMFKSKFTDRFNLTFGILVAITAGFLSIIGLQMYGASITFGGRQGTALAFAFIGVAIIALTTLLT